MIRAEDYDFDGGLDEALDELKHAQGRLGNIRDRLFILQSAYDEIARRSTSRVDAPPGGHGYIPIDLNLFFEGLFALEELLVADADYQHSDLRHRPLRFVDVGCGTGRLAHLLLATDRFAFSDIHGFDIDEGLIAKGKERFDLGDNIFVADCLSFDYTGYDIIFFYRPLKDDTKQMEFEQRVIEQMPVSGYLFCFGSHSAYDDRRLVIRNPNYGIFKRV
ncbi:MAG: class I SAM-dependent methyltransferase [Pseudomonadota bacterium]